MLLLMFIFTPGFAEALTITEETVPNPDVKKYGVRFPVCETKRPGHPSQNVMNELMEIKGIVRVERSNKYGIQIEKGSAFTWRELRPQIVEVLAKYAAIDFLTED